MGVPIVHYLQWPCHGEHDAPTCRNILNRRLDPFFSFMLSGPYSKDVKIRHELTGELDVDDEAVLRSLR